MERKELWPFMFFPIVPAIMLILALAYSLWFRPTCCPGAEERAASKYKLKVLTELGVNDQVDILMSINSDGSSKDKKRKSKRKSPRSRLFHDQMDKQQCQEGTYVSYNNV